MKDITVVITPIAVPTIIRVKAVDASDAYNRVVKGLSKKKDLDQVKIKVKSYSVAYSVEEDGT
jgi:hypothetical protein